MTENVPATVKQDFPSLLKVTLPEIARALPRHLNADTMCRAALTCFRLNPTLGRCDPRSVIAGVVQASQLGLQLGVQGQAYLVPYKRRDGSYECNFIPGWKGLLDLVSRSGRATAWTGAVYDGDEFEYAYGTNPFIKHVPASVELEQEANLRHVYAVGEVTGSTRQHIEVWSASKCRKHRDKYNKVGERHYSFQHFEMYARKLVLLQVLKYLPSSTELATAAAFEYSANMGAQGLTLEKAVDGTWVAPDLPAEEPVAEEAVEETKQTRTEQLKAALGGDL
jgi:recombination protein RecT